MARKKSMLRRYVRRTVKTTYSNSQQKKCPYKVHDPFRSTSGSAHQKPTVVSGEESLSIARTKIQKVSKSPLKSPLHRPLNHSSLSQKRFLSPALDRFRPSRFAYGAKGSPFRSPLFHPKVNSPAAKRFKGTKNSCKKIKQKVTNDTSAEDTFSATDSDEFGFEPLPVEENVAENSECESNAAKLIQLVPSVMDELAKHDDMDRTILSFFELVQSKTFPLDNTAFRLWTDVVKWFSCSSTTEMRYSTNSKKFWKLGWRIFGKRFVNFMGGFKSHGESMLNMTDAGHYSPGSSEINFAVPDLHVLRQFDPYEVGTESKPGIFEATIHEMSSNLRGKSACITYDGKKIKQGLTDDSGDVDLLGFEKGTTLRERQHLLEMERMEIKLLAKTLEDCEQQYPVNVRHNIHLLNNCNEIKESLMKQLKRIADREGEIEKVKKKKEYCKKKLIESSGPDWRKGKYVYAISAITAFIHDIDSFMTSARDISERICKCVAYINNELYVNGKCLNLHEDVRYLNIDASVSGNRQLPPCDTSTRIITQRSEEWHEIRNKAKVTGSTLFKSIGCDGLGRQKDHFDKVICGVPETEPSSEVKAMMEWGTKNEINAVATTVGKIIPVLEPGLKFYEEGCCTLNGERGDIFMVVSPDGSLRKSNQFSTTEVAIEIKCPTRNVHTEFPERYYLQCQAEMRTLNVERMLYISWTEEDTTVFKLTRDDELFDEAIQLAVDIYGKQKPKKPTRLSDETKNIKKEIGEKAKSVHMVGRFTSCKQSEFHTNQYDRTEKNIQYVKQLLEDIETCYKECYDLQREKATEAVVFLLADLDRSWKRDSIRCSPIAWFPKGYSLDCETMRSISEEVHTKCTEYGIHVPCESFDGQWHVLVVRSVSGEPLTVYQLQKDIWRQVEKMSKGTIIAELKSMNQSVTILNIKSQETEHDEAPRTCCIATNGGISLPIYRKVKSNKSKSSDESETLSAETTLADTVSEIVREATDMGEEVLAMCPVTDKFEKEAFSSNIKDDNCCREIEDLRDFANDNEIDEEHQSQDIEEIRIPVQIEIITQKDIERMISLLQTSKDSNKKGKWNDVNSQQFRMHFTSTKNLNKLLDIDLRVIVRYLRKSKGLQCVKESDKKEDKIKGIASFLGLSDEVPHVKRTVRKTPMKSLKELASKVTSKYSKEELNILMAEHRWQDAYNTWRAPVKDVTVNSEVIEWFYKPEYSSVRNQMEVKCIDSTHLLTRMRRKSCRGGLDMISNDSWLKVAKSRKTLLTPIMVEEITDPMSVSMAKTHFSEAVENEMRRNGDTDAAGLCNDIRNWWEAEDNSGINAESRINMRKPLRRRLLSRVDFTRFPPTTQNVAGWPHQLWEALLASIDAKVYLYGLSVTGTYNVRAFSSLIGETFFSELTLSDKTGKGTLTAKQFGEFVSRSTEQLQIRLDPERTFSYCTTKNKVYDTVDEAFGESDTQKHNELVYPTDSRTIPQQTIPRDHEFDLPQRRRLAGRKKLGFVSTERNAIQKGTLGVRYEKARTNYSKMLPTKRMGLE